MEKHLKILVIAALITGSVCFAFAEEVKFDLSLEKSAILPGRQTRLAMTFPAGVEVPPPDVPFIKGVDIRYIGRSDGDGGGAVHTYRIVPLSEGEIDFGPISFEYRGVDYVSDTVRLVVSEEKVEALQEKVKVEDEKKPDLSERIYLEVDIPKGRFFVNEKVPVGVRFYTDWLDVENLVISEAHSDHYISEQYVSGETRFVDKGGVRFAVLEFSKWFFVPEPGEYDFGPVRAAFTLTRKKADLLNENESFYNAFIGRRSTLHNDIESPVFAISVMPLPQADRPAEFRGAVGGFDLDVKVSPVEVRIGDSVTMEIKVTGDGNYNSINVPILGEDKGFSVYDPQVSRTDRGLEIRQVLRVLSAEARQTPEVTFAYFDPDREEYVTLRKPPVKIGVILPEGVKVAKDREKAAEKKIKEAEPAEILIGIKNRPGPVSWGDPMFYRSAWFSFFLAIPVFCLIAAMGIKKRMDILSADTPYTRRLRAAKKASEDMSLVWSCASKGDVDRFYGILFKAMREYLGTRFAIPPGGITDAVVDSKIAPVIKEESVALRIKEVLADCCLARYSSLGFGKEEMRTAHKKAREVINYLNGVKDI
jgi:hypothetical protein